MSSEMSPSPSGLASEWRLVNRGLGNPIPCVPFPFDKGKGRIFEKRGCAPLRHPNIIKAKERGK